MSYSMRTWKLLSDMNGNLYWLRHVLQHAKLRQLRLSKKNAYICLFFKYPVYHSYLTKHAFPKYPAILLSWKLSHF